MSGDDHETCQACAAERRRVKEATLLWLIRWAAEVSR